jgi:predicted esterase
MKKVAGLSLIVLLATLLAGCPWDDSRYSVAITTDAAPAAPPQTGLQTLSVDGETRSYYLDLPSDYDPAGPPKPLIIAYHGTGGSYQAWLDDYRLREVVGDGAILVYPDARPNAAGIKQWNFADDFRMFEELLAQLPANLVFDRDRIFVTGHSSGGGFTNEIGCRYGDRIRAIAPVAGGLTTASCVGAIAVIQIQGAKDSLVPLNIAQLAQRFWVLYNGFTVAGSTPGVVAECVDRSKGAVTDYPVQWCVHQEGDGPTAHAWPSFANQAIWSFFQSLAPVPPQAGPPPGGGNDKALAGSDTTLSFTLEFPTGMPTPLFGAAVLYPPGTRQPIGDAPLVFLNTNFAPAASPGDQHSYQIPVKLEGATMPGDYTVEIVIYVEGGSFPIPASGVDQTALADVTIPDSSTPIVVPGVLTLEPVQTAF